MIQKLIEQKLLEPKEKRIRSGKYSPSSFGRCFRLQYWNRKDEPQSNPMDLNGLYLTEQGKATHKLIQSFLPKEAVEIKVEIDDVLGYADIVLDDCVTDIKCKDEWKFKKYSNIPTPVFIEKNEANFLQVGFYGLVLKTKYIAIRSNVFGCLNQYVLHRDLTSNWKDKVNAEIKTLRYYWEKGLPPAEPRAFGGNDCAYCSFSDKCKEVENGKV